MARHIWSVLCRKQLVDNDSKQVSLIDMMEKATLSRADIEQQAKSLGMSADALLAEGFFFPLPMHLVTFWTRDDPELPEVSEATVRILTPKGKVQAENRIPIDLTDYRNSRPVLRLPGVVFVGTGIYRVVVAKRDKSGKRLLRQAEIPFEVDVASQAPTLWRQDDIDAEIE